METYLFKLKYYNKYNDENKDMFGTVVADSFEEALNRIQWQFPNMSELTIGELPLYNGFTYLTENEYNIISKDL